MTLCPRQLSCCARDRHDRRRSAPRGRPAPPCWPGHPSLRAPLAPPLPSLSHTHPNFHPNRQGAPDSFDFRIFQNTKGTVVSAWHDVPLYAGDGLLHFVCEIPKESAAKMELATDEVNNPIKQDTKKGKLRFYPYNIHWNYGMLPQTWEDPDHKNPECFNAGVSREGYAQREREEGSQGKNRLSHTPGLGQRMTHPWRLSGILQF